MTLNVLVFDHFIVIGFSQGIFTIFERSGYVDDKDVIVVFNYNVWAAFIGDTRDLLVDAHNARFYSIG